ncbi:MAG: hypothetical protein M0C28_27480 [Candidatus Moduliflexus flocculans]|nr:hypothetical protein [Candidatus Moduliflexus flocculans]
MIGRPRPDRGDRVHRHPPLRDRRRQQDQRTGLRRWAPVPGFPARHRPELPDHADVLPQSGPVHHDRGRQRHRGIACFSATRRG